MRYLTLLCGTPFLSLFPRHRLATSKTIRVIFPPTECREAITADALATSFGFMLGINLTTSCYLKCGGSVETGARTGLVAVFRGLFFFISHFFCDDFRAWTSGGSLVMKSPVDALSAFLAVMLMSFTYSIANALSMQSSSSNDKIGK